MYRCAVLYAHSVRTGAATVPVAAIAWTGEHAPVISWVPLSASADSAWRDILATYDTPLDQVIDYWADNPTPAAAIELCPWPIGAADARTATEMLLDRLLYDGRL